MADIVNAIMLVQKTAYGRTFKKGELVEVIVLKHGGAKLALAPTVILPPNQYRLHIPDKDFDKLLNQGDMV